MCRGCWVARVGGGVGSDLPGTWTPPSNDGKIRGREGGGSGFASYHRGLFCGVRGIVGEQAVVAVEINA